MSLLRAVGWTLTAWALSAWVTWMLVLAFGEGIR
jgi:hypothetical protein